MRKIVGMYSAILDEIWYNELKIRCSMYAAGKDVLHMANEKKSIMQEFKEFISRGNVIDMAVGVIIGGAFTAIVNSLVTDILTPIIGTFLFGLNFNSFGISIPWGNHPYIDFGGFIQNIITFLLTAICLFLIIKGINVLRRKKPDVPAAPPAPSKEEVLLTEIRDLLKAQNGIVDAVEEKTE